MAPLLRGGFASLPTLLRNLGHSTCLLHWSAFTAIDCFCCCYCGHCWCNSCSSLLDFSENPQRKRFKNFMDMIRSDPDPPKNLSIFIRSKGIESIKSITLGVFLNQVEEELGRWELISSYQSSSPIPNSHEAIPILVCGNRRRQKRSPNFFFSFSLLSKKE